MTLETKKAMPAGRQGFTMIEMLVVISIIGILAALALVSFTNTQKQARDSQRKSELKQYQTALENYATKNTSLYPAYPGGTAADGSLCGDLALGSCPVDPKNVSPHIYRYISNGTIGDTATVYSFFVGLEKSTTITYWVVCSTGKNGESTTIPTGGNICPL